MGDAIGAIRRPFGGVSRARRVQVASVLALFAVWIAATRVIHPLILPGPDRVLSAWTRIILSGELINGIMLSLSSLVIGLALALVIGIASGVVMGGFRSFAPIADTLLALILVVPMVGLIPTLVVALGLGLEIRVVTVFLFSVPIVALNSYSGTRSVDARWLEMAVSFGAGGWRRLMRVVLPAAVPGIAAGVRLGVGRALVGMVVAELLIVSVGLGLLLQKYSGRLMTAELYATIFTVIALGYAMARGSQVIERRVMRRLGFQSAFGR
jgi:NitT/TauT family transport system permease protein